MKSEDFNNLMVDFDELDEYVNGLVKKDIPVPIDLEKRAKERLNSIKVRKRKYLKISIIVAALLISITAISVSANIIRIFSDKTTADTGLQLADKEGFVDIRSNSIEYNGVTLTVDGVLSDSIRTSIRILVTGNKVAGKNIRFGNIYLENSRSESYLAKKVPVIEKGSNQAILDFEGVKTYSSEEKLTLKVESINDINGTWTLAFPVHVVHDQKVYILNKEYYFGENKVTISSIKSTVSRTQIELRDYFGSKDKMTRVNMFYLIVNGKRYQADNFTDPLDNGETSVTDHRKYIINFNTNENVFSLSDNVSLELEYGIAENRVVHRIKMN